jgi:ssDNA-specific exonuclease RecJ
LEKLVLLSQFVMRVLSRLYKVWEANQSNHLRKAWEVNQFSRLYKALEVAQSNS